MERRGFVYLGVGAVAGTVLAAVAAACGDDEDMTGPDTLEIRIVDNAFQPATATIQRGTRVRWRKTTSTFHTVTPDGHSEWQRWTTNDGTSFEHTFNTAGTFAYYCEPHRSLGMVGRIIVQ